MRLGRRPALVVIVVLLLFVALLSLRIGSADVSNGDALDALFSFDDSSYDQVVVRSLRVPRTLIGLGVGAALAVAGAAMQAVTRNPLAGPSIFGINGGAAFLLTLAVFVGNLTHPMQFIWFAFIGGFGAAALVYAVASAGAGGPSPVKLALAGVIVSSLLGSWMTAMLLLDEQAFEVVRFWLAGSLAGRDVEVFWWVMPFMIVGVVGIALMSNQLNILALGEDTARALGMRIRLVRFTITFLVVLMTGAAVAAAGPIGFVGLAVPHIVRVVTGPDYRWIVLYCVLVGPLLLLTADVAGRVVARPSELQVGIVTALTGAPFLIFLARQRRIAEL